MVVCVWITVLRRGRKVQMIHMHRCYTSWIVNYKYFNIPCAIKGLLIIPTPIIKPPSEWHKTKYKKRRAKRNKFKYIGEEWRGEEDRHGKESV